NTRFALGVELWGRVPVPANDTGKSSSFAVPPDKAGQPSSKRGAIVALPLELVEPDRSDASVSALDTLRFRGHHATGIYRFMDQRAGCASVRMVPSHEMPQCGDS
ncbi:MAG: hypothetical protein RL710_2665, partial [Pseudomonadota bacterium]